MLAIHSLVVSRFLPSSLFLIVFCCWVWVGVSALVDRIEAAWAMAVSTTAILLLVLLAMQITALGSGELRAFYFLAMFPALTAWICVCVFIHHIQRAEDVTDGMLETWFEEQEAKRIELDTGNSELGQNFTAAMMSGASHDNGRSKRRIVRIANSKQKAAS